ncbi:RNA polymerase sigma factor [Sorangium sp. So ce693]|uniref:RNA polymerase sigma factor n=1 Tax=Sorangium sp. So ce693 TaxID=3133318 RepID=UPI003F5DD621
MSEAGLDALAIRACAGDREALEALVRGLQDPLFRLARRFLGHPEDARDATQEILILIVTKLSTFRGESSISTWAYRVACRHLLRARATYRRLTFEQLVDEDLAKAPNAIGAEVLESAEARLLEEEVFLRCTQAMLQALDRPLRIAYVLGGICELESTDAAYALGITEAAFRKRLSRARAALDAFVSKHCGVANPANPCRCAFQVNHNVALGRLNPRGLVHAKPTERTSLEALQALGEIRAVRRSLELYRAQPAFTSPEDLAARVRSMIAIGRGSRLFDA